MSKVKFYVQAEGWILDKYRKVNDVIEADPKEVRYIEQSGAIARTRAATKNASAPSGPAGPKDQKTGGKD